MGIETVAIAGLIVSAAAGGYAAYESNQQTKEIKKQGEQAQRQAQQAQQQMDTNTRQSVMLNQRRQALAGMGNGTLRDTILTGPTGVPLSGQPVGGKSLLGM